MIFVCLGNYEKEYDKTRHNFGRKFGEFLIGSQDDRMIVNSQKKKDGTIYTLENGWKIIFLNCFMNESGKYLKQMLKSKFVLQRRTTLGRQVQYDIKELIVVHDDLDLHFGEFKIQFRRGPAGHHGVESIIQALGTQDFWRIRLGIGNHELEKNIPPQNFVLMRFTEDEEKAIPQLFEKVITDLSTVLL